MWFREQERWEGARTTIYLFRGKDGDGDIWKKLKVSFFTPVFDLFLYCAMLRYENKNANIMRRTTTVVHKKGIPRLHLDVYM